MRGRVLVLIGAIILLAIVVVVVLMSGGGGDEEEGGGTPPPADVIPRDTPEPPADGGEDGGEEPTEEAASGLEIEMVKIVVAVQYLPRGRMIPTEAEIEAAGGLGPAVMVQPWPRQALLLPIEDHYFTDVDQVTGQIARTDIYRGQPILKQHVVPSLSDIARTGSDAAAILANIDRPGNEEYVAVSLPLDWSGVGQVAFAIQDGDYVDVILSFLFIDVDEEFQTRLPNTLSVLTLAAETGELSIGTPRQGRVALDNILASDAVLLGPSEQSQRPRLVTQMTVTDAFVVHVGYFPEGGRFIGPTPTVPGVEAPLPPPPAEGAEGETPSPTATTYRPVIITLGVTPQDALVLTWAVDAGIPITLALREANDGHPERVLVGLNSEDDGIRPVTLGYMVERFQLPDPPDAETFALEPPITSVRRFDIAALFSFYAEVVAGEEE